MSLYCGLRVETICLQYLILNNIECMILWTISIGRKLHCDSFRKLFIQSWKIFVLKGRYINSVRGMGHT